MDWLTADYQTLFQLDDLGRIVRENDPDHSPGPRFWLAGCAEGNILGIRADVPREVAVRLEDLAADEPPFLAAASPKHFDRYLSVVGAHAAVESHTLGLIHALPPGLPDASPASLVDSDGAEGQALLHRFAVDGMPRGLAELGFRSPADFWAPWCGAMADGQIVSIAFAARLSDVGAELGVATATAFRRRGFAAAATAGWSRLPSLRTCTLFYSTVRDNFSSQRVAARLGLALRGASLRIY